MEKSEKERNPEVLQLARRIKELRLLAGYSSAEIFAYEHDISRSHYARCENGQDMRFSSIVKICKAHSIGIKEFFSEGFD